VCVRVYVCMCSLNISVFSERGVCWNLFGKFQFRPYLPDTILYQREEQLNLICMDVQLGLSRPYYGF